MSNRSKLRKLTAPRDGEASRVAIFGGSFNPIHIGHMRIAQELISDWGFSKVLFVPNGTHYRKKGLIDEKPRVDMIELAIANEPRFELCDFELGRDRVIYTHETVLHLEKELGVERGETELYLIRGSDIIRKMLRWRNLETLLRCKIVVPVRPGSDPWSSFGEHKTFQRHSERFLLMEREYGDGLSSTIIRRRCQLGHSVRYLVPVAVEEYLAKHGVYR